MLLWIYQRSLPPAAKERSAMADPKEPTLLVGVDYSDPGLVALLRAVDLTENGTLHFVHAIDWSPSGPMAGIPAPPALETEAKKLHDYAVKHIPNSALPPAHPSRRFVSHIAVGSPAREIAQLASDLEADLIVVGTHGRTGLRRLLLGSVAEGVLRLASCPVLVERPKANPSDGVPEITPPCPRCVDARFASDGKELWCEQHRERHGRRHTYFSTQGSSAFPSSHPGLGSVS
jgi:nucleotide-binding universal stress UspA family protein